jgi:hypothetical protein
MLGCYAFNKTQLQKKTLITTYNKKNTKSNNKNLQDETTNQHKRIVLLPSWKVQITIFLHHNKANMSTRSLTTTSFSYIYTMDLFVVTLKLPLFVNHILSRKARCVY